MSRYTQPEWNEPLRKFECVQNGYGHWWPNMYMRPNETQDNWYPFIIRNSNPFKTLKGAIKFTEATIARIKAREAKDAAKLNPPQEAP